MYYWVLFCCLFINLCNIGSYSFSWLSFDRSNFLCPSQTHLIAIFLSFFLFVYLPMSNSLAFSVSKCFCSNRCTFNLFICLWLSKYIFFFCFLFIYPPLFCSWFSTVSVFHCMCIEFKLHFLGISFLGSYSAHLSALKVLHSRWSCIRILNHLVKFQLIMKFSSKQQLWKWAGHEIAKIRVKLSCKVFDRKINHWFSFLSVCLELIIICCPTHNHEMRY